MLETLIQTGISIGHETAQGCMWGEWWHLPAAFLLTAAGILGHELTHAVLMWPISERVEFVVHNKWTLDIDVESTFRDDEWRHTWADLAGAAPLMLTMLGVAAIWLLDAWPDPSTMLGIGFYNALLWYGVMGGLSDYSRDASVAAHQDEVKQPPLQRPMSDGGQAFVQRQTRLLGTLLVALLATGVALLYATTCAGTVATTGYYGGVVGGILALTAGVALLRRAKQAGIRLQ
jgi:hypothetical protein